MREATAPSEVYSIAVCGERPAFEKTVTLPQLRWDFKSEWDQSDFFIAPLRQSSLPSPRTMNSTVPF